MSAIYAEGQYQGCLHLVHLRQGRPACLEIWLVLLNQIFTTKVLLVQSGLFGNLVGHKKVRSSKFEKLTSRNRAHVLINFNCMLDGRPMAVNHALFTWNVFRGRNIWGFMHVWFCFSWLSQKEFKKIRKINKPNIKPICHEVAITT